MAIYHLSIKIISRGKGKSAVAAAAYRAGETITNEYDGITHNYTRKRGIVHTEILLPDHAPKVYFDRAVLWNAVEKVEKNSNSQLAREIEVALPLELSREQNISLVHDYVQRHFVEKGMCADLCVHDVDGTNPHAHILLTMRPINMDGTWGEKQKKEYAYDTNGDKVYDKAKKQYKCKSIPTTDWNDKGKAEEWRAVWAESINAALEKQGTEIRLDHRSYERQGGDQVPTVHLGVAASQMEKKGVHTELGDKNRAIEVSNRELRMLNARINKLKDWLAEKLENNTPNLQDIISEILSGRCNKTHWQRSSDLKTASKTLLFLQNNKITDMAGLQDKVAVMRGRFNDVSAKLKANERRATVLDEHIRQAEYMLECKPIYEKYKLVNLKYREEFREIHRREITLYETADKYFKAHMNGKSGLPVKAWKAERTKLTAERKSLFSEYTLLKDETHAAETIKRNVENLLRKDSRDGRLVRTQGIEL